jgi:hypothetical protein
MTMRRTAIEPSCCGNEALQTSRAGVSDRDDLITLLCFTD